MNNTFNKSSFRTIKSSISRFLAILLISFLGAGVFAGLFAVSPNMQQVADKYYKDYNTMDINMISTFGFSEEDVEIIRKDDEGVIDGVMPSYSIDSSGVVSGSSYTFRLNSLINNTNSKNYINQLNVIEGRLPNNNNEVIVIRPSTGLKNIEINSKINLIKSSNEMLDDFIDNFEYKVVGIAESPYHLDFLQGNTSLGSGIIDFVLYTKEESFISEYYTNIYIKLRDSDNYDLFSDDYEEYVDKSMKGLESIANEREYIIYNSLTDELIEAKEELERASIKLDDGILEYKENLNLYNENYQLYLDNKLLLEESKILLDSNEEEFLINKQKITDKGYTLDDVEYNLIPLLDFSIKQKKI